MKISQERLNGPIIKPIQKIDLPEVNSYTLDNGIDVYEIAGGSQQVIKLEIIFESGRLYESKRTVSRTVGSLLKEGCEGYNSAQLASAFEYFGATFSTSSDLDFTKITLFCLTKYFNKLLPIVIKVITTPSFSKEELSLYQTNIAQRLQVDLKKNDVIAYRAFTQNIFGKTHPYGYNSTPENYLALSQDDLVEEFENNFGTNRCKVFISGNVTKEVRNVLAENINRYDKIASREKNIIPVNLPAPNSIKLKSTNEYQSAIRIGRKLFTRSSEDYVGMSVLATLLGGYFGSRLMTNIREDKGFTYNIYASIDNLLGDGYFYIGTEVGKEYTTETLKEIYHELENLRTVAVPVSELEMVKNYLTGNFLNELDGPLKSSKIVRSLVTAGLDLAYFDKTLEEIHQIGPDRLCKLANKYLNTDSLSQILVE